jgi:hypothetical protein
MTSILISWARRSGVPPKKVSHAPGPGFDARTS